MKKMMIVLFVCSCCFLFAGCSSKDTVSANNGADTESTMENELSDIEPVVEDNWPDSIGRENKKTTAENLSFEIQISEPTVLSVTCVTESGKLDMEIESDDGEKVFSESDIQTENFEIDIDSSGIYKATVQAKEHTGSFWIEPRK